MVVDSKLESYLAQLDKALANMPVSDRADIVTEIKSHVLAAHEKEPQQSIGQILAALGEPETVANRYLIERGLKPGRRSLVPVVKWLVIGFLGTLTLIVLLLVVLFWRFTPIMEVKDNQFRALGGLIRVDDVDGFDFGHGNKFQLEGEIDTQLGIKQAKVQFANGEVDVRPSEDSTIRWQCDLLDFGATDDAPAPHQKDDTWHLEMQGASGADCEIELPAGVALDIKGGNGQIRLSQPRQAVQASLGNGKVEIHPADGTAYKYNFKVGVGSIDPDFKSSDKAEAYPVDVTLKIGAIGRE